MNLLKEIEKAQKKGTAEFNTFGGKQGWHILAVMSPEAQLFWRRENLPPEILTLSDLDEIKRYVERCGIIWPKDDDSTPAKRK